MEERILGKPISNPGVQKEKEKEDTQRLIFHREQMKAQGEENPVVLLTTRHQLGSFSSCQIRSLVTNRDARQITFISRQFLEKK